MRLLSFLLLLLAGCSPIDQQALLNDYASNATNSAKLENYLTGDALDSGRKSLELLADLGLIQVGSASFLNVRKVSKRLLSACLDVTNVEFLDAEGKRVHLENRTLRQAVTIWLDQQDAHTKISRLEVGAQC